MSILLDALKKSEAQRQLGQAPDIYSGHGTESSTSGKRPNWLLLALLAVAVALAAWLGWRQFGPVETTGGSDGNARQVAVPEAAAEQTAGDGQQQLVPTAQKASDDQDVRGQRTPVESYSADTTAVRDGAAQPGADPRGITRKALVGESLSKSDTDGEISENEPPAKSNVGPAEPAVAPAAKKTAARAARAEPESPGTAPISFWELPQDVRDSLPDLHITVLVYAEEPAERFVLIGGKRLVEKEQVDQGVVLEEIRREGAVFRYRSYLFLVKS